jgi:hypothetical protein
MSTKAGFYYCWDVVSIISGCITLFISVMRGYIMTQMQTRHSERGSERERERERVTYSDSEREKICEKEVEGRGAGLTQAGYIFLSFSFYAIWAAWRVLDVVGLLGGLAIKPKKAVGRFSILCRLHLLEKNNLYSCTKCGQQAFGV